MNKQVYSMEIVDSTTALEAGLNFFILASGSDSRAYEILSKIHSRGGSDVKVIILHYKERLKGKGSNDDLFKFKNYKIDYEISCNIQYPSTALEALKEIGFTSSDKIALDISCLTKPYFFYLIRLFKERFKASKLKVFYTEPKSYFFPKGIFSLFHTSTGPLSIIEIPGYSGLERRNSTKKLVILLGFDGDLSEEITQDVSPNETVVINGFPSYSPKFKDISLIANEKLVSDGNIKVRYARANNPFDVYNVLETIKEESDQATFMNIAPLGTKPMALGVCLFALHNPEVRVVYPMPELYKDKYSDKCWNSWAYELPLTL
jgi:hypothetical protein